MPRRPRLSTGGIAYHVLNRRVGRLELFEKPADYFAFEKILAQAHHRTGMRIAGKETLDTNFDGYYKGETLRADLDKFFKLQGSVSR